MLRSLKPDTSLFLGIVESIVDPVFVKDKQYRFAYVNQAFCTLYCQSKDEIIGKTDFDIFTKKQATICRQQDEQIFSNLSTHDYISKIKNSTTQQTVISTRKSILNDNNGNHFLLGIIKNITNETRREKHQEQITEILKQLVLGAPQEDILNIALKVAEEALPGVIATILLLDKQTNRLHPPVQSRLPSEFSEAIDGTPAREGMGSCGEAVFRRKRFIVERIADHPNWHRVSDLALKHNLKACWSQPVFNFSGEVYGTFALYFPHETAPEPFELEVLTTLAQLTAIALEYHHIQQETKTLRILMADIINAMPSLLIAVDRQGHVLQWNTEAEKVTGISATKALGCKLNSVLNLNTDLIKDIDLAINDHRSLNLTRISQQLAGEIQWFDLTLYPINSHEVGSVIRIDIVTDRVKLERMMVQAEKINSLGGLAAGIAHEINNPLASILQNVQVIRNRLQEGLEVNKRVANKCGCGIEKIESYLKERNIFTLIDTIVESGERASDIIINMLNFSQKENVKTELNSLPKLMDKTIALLDNDYNHNQKYDFRKIDISRDYVATLPEIMCGGGNLQQVFFSLLKNAAQAIAATENPQIHIRIYVTNERMQIEIEDNGSGMNQETQQHIFDPFYTEQSIGTGAGLGLSVAHFIITETAQGKLSVDSQIGRGTIFTIELPIILN